MVGKIIKNIIAIALIACAFITAIDMYRMFSVKNAEYGTPETIYTATNTEEIVKFDIGFIDFQPGEATLFETTFTENAIEDFNGITSIYLIYVNENIISNISTSAGSLNGVIIKNFYNTQNQIDVRIEILIKMTFQASKTTLTFGTNNTAEELSYFTTYQNINGLVVQVVKQI